MTPTVPTPASHARPLDTDVPWERPTFDPDEARRRAAAAL